MNSELVNAWVSQQAATLGVEPEVSAYLAAVDAWRQAWRPERVRIVLVAERRGVKFDPESTFTHEGTAVTRSAVWSVTGTPAPVGWPTPGVFQNHSGRSSLRRNARTPAGGGRTGRDVVAAWTNASAVRRLALVDEAIRARVRRPHGRHLRFNHEKAVGLTRAAAWAGIEENHGDTRWNSRPRRSTRY
ncbi:MAG: hypothetical protein K8T90_12210 [Planctomycetes bacterium]|nr:hypothetical protein [Planctomycetota bacterium]